jgi:hypothetical protein
LEGYYIALTKPERQALLASFCDNIVNHKRKKCLKKYFEGYCIAIAKPRVPSKTLFGLSFKQDVFCRRLFFAIPLLFVTRM